MKLRFNFSALTCFLALAVLLMGCDQSTLLTEVEPGERAAQDAGTLTGVLAKQAGQTVEGQYIVVFSDGVSDVGATARQLAKQSGGTLGFVYQHALKGFSLSGISAAGVAALERNPSVAYVEQDQTVTIFGEVPTGVARIFADTNAEIDIDATDDFRVDADIAIIDTGIDLDHVDLNVVASTDCSGGSPFSGSCGSGGDDDNGHGTHVAGSAAAIDNGTGVVGVAPGARLWAVKVLRADGSGYMSWIVAGIDYVTANSDKIEVANMSLGCECSSDAMDTAIANSVGAGVAYAVAAGNSDADASTFSPANHPDVLTVSALADFDGAAGGKGSPTCRTDQDDTLADFSNWGSTVEVAAPGVCIRSTWNDGGYNTISGTSMASPHSAGALALLASANNPANATDVKNLYSTVIDNGNLNWSDDSGDGIQERLLDVGDPLVFDPVLVSGGGGGGTTNSAPTASFTYSCADLTCDFDGSGSTDSDGSISSYEWDVDGDGTIDYTTATVKHTYASGGTYTVTLTVTDDAGATDTESQSVSVSDGTSDASGMHVGDLDGAGVNNGPSWTAQVTITVHDASHVAVSSAAVSGTWSNGASGSASCTTDTNGQCTVEVSGIPKKNSTVSFSVDNVEHGSHTYSATDNHDPDGDSKGTTIIVNKP